MMKCTTIALALLVKCKYNKCNIASQIRALYSVNSSYANWNGFASTEQLENDLIKICVRHDSLQLSNYVEAIKRRNDKHAHRNV